MLPVQREIRKLKNPLRAEVMQRFFKTGKGQYGEGDVFLGLSVPQSRKIARDFSDITLKEIQTLLNSEIHEERLVALLILVQQFERGSEALREKIYKFYLRNAKRVNNWDLVDTSAEWIVGGHLLYRDRDVLYKLAKSKNLWERRISIMSTFHFIKNKESKDTVKIALLLMTDRHDLIHKAVGWMLREMGKRVDEKLLHQFIQAHGAKMPRTMLRYAIERLSAKDRQKYMKLGKVKPS